MVSLSEVSDILLSLLFFCGTAGTILHAPQTFKVCWFYQCWVRQDKKQSLGQLPQKGHKLSAFSWSWQLSPSVYNITDSRMLPQASDFSFASAGPGVQSMLVPHQLSNQARQEPVPQAGSWRAGILD